MREERQPMREGQFAARMLFEAQKHFADVTASMLTALPAVDRSGSVQKVIDQAEEIFRRAGLVLPGFQHDGGLKGLPPRGTLIELKEKRSSRSNNWIPAESWEVATRVGKVTSRKPMQGAKDGDGEPRPCFNVRRAYYPNNHSEFHYSPKRFYLDQEGITWRWVT